MFSASDRSGSSSCTCTTLAPARVVASESESTGTRGTRAGILPVVDDASESVSTGIRGTNAGILPVVDDASESESTATLGTRAGMLPVVDDAIEAPACASPTVTFSSVLPVGFNSTTLARKKSSKVSSEVTDSSSLKAPNGLVSTGIDGGSTNSNERTGEQSVHELSLASASAISTPPTKKPVTESLFLQSLARCPFFPQV